MTDFMTMDAGPELDALVAVRVMGWLRIPSALNDSQTLVVPPGGNPYLAEWWWGKSVYELVPHYSTEIAHMWRVIEMLRGGPFRGANLKIEDDEYGIQVWNERNDRLAPGIYAKTMPLAICRAALKYTQEKG